jgi:hypothetical protein
LNNKPVAYGKYIENAKMWLVVELDADMPEGYIPLYTHPAKTLTDAELALTDVEINLIAEEFTGADGLDVVDFGRAILRKAQEK